MSNRHAQVARPCPCSRYLPAHEQHMWGRPSRALRRPIGRSTEFGIGLPIQAQHLTLEALGKECVQIVQIGVHVKVALPVFGDVERRAESIVISAKEMWRALDAPFHALM